MLKDRILEEVVHLHDVSVDKYGRLLATVLHRGEDVSAWMLARGAAVPRRNRGEVAGPRAVAGVAEAFPRARMPCYRCGRRGITARNVMRASTSPALRCRRRKTEVSSSYSDDDEYEGEEAVWCCNYCHKEFSTEQGARFHQMRWCKHAPARSLAAPAAPSVAPPGVACTCWCWMTARGTGKSDNMSSRIDQHLGGAGASAWCAKGGTARARGAPCTPPMRDLNLWEQKETVEQMLRHGCNRVRGWEFTQCAPLTRGQLATLESLVFGSETRAASAAAPGTLPPAATPPRLPPAAQQLRQLRQ